MVLVLGRRIGRVAVRGLGLLMAVACGSMVAGEARGQGPAPAAGSGVTLDGLLGMSPAEIEGIYRQGTAVAIAPGRVRGTALLATGTLRARALSRGARLVWQGKVIEPDQATAVNRFFGMRMIRGQLAQGPSWLDGAPALILDYSRTSRIYARNRDEIREVAPGLFLGLMYDRTAAPPRLSMYFALETVD
jgi:hypothetical protein